MKNFRFPLIFLLLLFFAQNLPADVFDKPEFVHAVRKYYRIIDAAKQPYLTELRKELDYAQKQGNVPYYNEIEAELKHVQSENGHIVTEYMPKTRFLFNNKLQLKQTVDRTQASFKRYARVLAGELLKIKRIDEAKSMQMVVDLSEPPRHLGRPNDFVPIPPEAKGKQHLRNLLAIDEQPKPILRQVNIPVVRTRNDNPFVVKPNIPEIKIDPKLLRPTNFPLESH